MLANDFDVPREKVTSWTPKAGGAPSNVAGCLAKLGVPVILVSALGDDDLGHNLVNYLKSDLNSSPFLRSHLRQASESTLAK